MELICSSLPQQSFCVRWWSQNFEIDPSLSNMLTPLLSRCGSKSDLDFDSNFDQQVDPMLVKITTSSLIKNGANGHPVASILFGSASEEQDPSGGLVASIRFHTEGVYSKGGQY